MKKIFIILITLTFCLISTLTFGQYNKNNRKYNDKKIQAEKVAFITERLDLTVEEAQIFWPVYNEYNDKMTQLFTEEHNLYREIKRNFETLSEEDLTTKTDRLIVINNEKTELSMEYHEKYKKLLPIKKLALLYQTDKEFRKHLMHKYKDPTKEE